MVEYLDGEGVLLVDDEPLILEATAAMLEELGCETLTAATSSEALKRLAREPQIEGADNRYQYARDGGYELAERAKLV